MLFKEKLNVIKENILSYAEKQLPASTEESSLMSLNDLDRELDLLIEDNECSILKTPVKYTKELVRLIILLDISGSMLGTERDIYLGLKEVIEHHKKDNILLTLIAFNEEKYILFDDEYIGNVDIPEIFMNGGTNLNGTLYYAIQNKCKDGINLLVTISDGKDNVDEINASKVKSTLTELSNEHNYFYFLGEPTKEQIAEDVYKEATLLGFNEENISIFTRLGNGNRINFSVISQMLDELLKYGKISNEWSKPIKDHYLAITDKKRC